MNKCVSSEQQYRRIQPTSAIPQICEENLAVGLNDIVLAIIVESHEK